MASLTRSVPAKVPVNHMSASIGCRADAVNGDVQMKPNLYDATGS